LAARKQELAEAWNKIAPTVAQCVKEARSIDSQLEHLWNEYNATPEVPGGMGRYVSLCRCIPRVFTLADGGKEGRVLWDINLLDQELQQAQAVAVSGAGLGAGTPLEDDWSLNELMRPKELTV
jgi:hypothetical protein